MVHIVVVFSQAAGGVLRLDGSNLDVATLIDRLKLPPILNFGCCPVAFPRWWLLMFDGKARIGPSVTAIFSSSSKSSFAYLLLTQLMASLLLQQQLLVLSIVKKSIELD